MIHYAIQHHPSRADLLKGLLDAVPSAQVVTDPDPDNKLRSPMRTYRACLDSIPPDADFLAVIQDDALPCRNFTEAVERLTEAKPDVPICLFIPGVGRNQQRMLDACYRGERWMTLDPLDWLPTVALILPRFHVKCLLDFIDRKNYPESRRADDSVLGDWARETRTRIVAPVPSLVEHLDSVPSLVGTSHWAGLNPQRIAACWMGTDLDPLDFDW